MDKFKSYINPKYLFRDEIREFESGDKITAYSRGKEMFEQLVGIAHNRYRFNDAGKQYAIHIVDACSMYTYDSRIDNEEMYKFLEMAEEKNMKVAVVLNDYFLPG